jgi:hypothetical protein
MFARIICIANLPAKQNQTSLTALRLATYDGVQARYIADSPLAATLKAGEWITLNASDEHWATGIVVLPTPRMYFWQAKDERSVRYGLRDMGLGVAHPPDGDESYPAEHPNHDRYEKFKALALEFFNEMKTARRVFGLESREDRIPDDVMIEMLPKDTHATLRKTIASWD